MKVKFTRLTGQHVGVSRLPTESTLNQHTRIRKGKIKMPKEQSTPRGQLIELEKLVKKILRNSIKDNTLDYTVQISVSSNEPEEVKYAAMISAPKEGVQPITYIFDNFKDLKAALVESEKEVDTEKIEITFHESRINTYKTKIAAHEQRLKDIENGEADIEMEEV